MKQFRCATLMAILLAYSTEARSTDRFFSDESAESPLKRFKVEAKSPDNAGKEGRPAFQASFVYTCRDAIANKILWTRAQPMRKPQQIGTDPTRVFQFPDEGSPVELFVSDAGWTVIWTGWDELIAVDLTGHDRCRIKLLRDAFTEDENQKYVEGTTAGPMWSGYSLWYFLDVGKQRLFVIRPWWGRRVILNLEAGKLLNETKSITESAEAYERNDVMTELTKGVETRQKWEQDKYGDAVWPIRYASYLAGRIPVPEAAPLLEKLQDAVYSGSWTGGGLGYGERFDGEVNPHSYHTLTLRQVTRLSLRRLGVKPQQFPAISFEVQYEVYEKHHPYVPKPLSVSREANADKVKVGMKAEQILDLLGGPDFVGYRTWEYDMDANPPFSLILTWNVRQVTEVQTTSPVAWKDGFTRDKQVVR